jgi:hypothetical protein
MTEDIIKAAIIHLMVEEEAVVVAIEIAVMEDNPIAMVPIHDMTVNLK